MEILPISGVVLNYRMQGLDVSEFGLGWFSLVSMVVRGVQACGEHRYASNEGAHGWLPEVFSSDAGNIGISPLPPHGPAYPSHTSSMRLHIPNGTPLHIFFALQVGIAFRASATHASKYFEIRR